MNSICRCLRLDRADLAICFFDRAFVRNEWILSQRVHPFYLCLCLFSSHSLSILPHNSILSRYIAFRRSATHPKNIVCNISPLSMPQSSHHTTYNNIKHHMFICFSRQRDRKVYECAHAQPRHSKDKIIHSTLYATMDIVYTQRRCSSFPSRIEGAKEKQRADRQKNIVTYIELPKRFRLETH